MIATISLGLLIAQEDSVNMTPGYALDVFYSLENGAVQTVANAEWTVAFSTSSQSSQIMVNDGLGVELYNLDSDISGFTSLGVSDTVGMSTWTQLRNSFEDWEHSAFESGSTGHPDYGWGEYSSSTHDVTGNKIFLIKTLLDEYYKVMPVVKHNGAWTYRYATLDNSFDTTIVYQASDLQDRNFVYLNMDNHTMMDREPANTDWDLLFTKYYDAVGEYPVTGVLSNKNIEILQIDGVSNASASTFGGTFSEATYEIGWDWKTFNMTTFQYDLAVDRTYFVKKADDSVYKIFFTRFDGSSTGKTVFNKEEYLSLGINKNEKLRALSIFPNPANDIAHIVFDSNINTVVNITVYNIVGKTISTQKTSITSGLNDIKIDVNNFHKGIYLVKIQYGNNTQTLKMNVAK